MSNLAVNVVVDGSPGTGLTVSVYASSLFFGNPQRGHAVPNSAAAATGTTDGSGDVTLTGLSVESYQLVVVDARGVNNWFPVGSGYVGGAYTATIPWSTPVNATAPVSIGGDTPGGSTLSAPWAQREHFHALPPLAGDFSVVLGTLDDVPGPHAALGGTSVAGGLVDFGGLVVITLPLQTVTAGDSLVKAAVQYVTPSPSDTATSWSMTAWVLDAANTNVAKGVSSGTGAFAPGPGPGVYSYVGNSSFAWTIEAGADLSESGVDLTSAGGLVYAVYLQIAVT